MKNVFEISKNTYDVFIGAGWDNWARIQWNPIEKKWSMVKGNYNLFRQALTEFNNERNSAK